MKKKPELAHFLEKQICNAKVLKESILIDSLTASFKKFRFLFKNVLHSLLFLCKEEVLAIFSG